MVWRTFFIRSVQEDSHGRIWVSTNNGISHWDERKQRFENYDYRDGVPMGNLVERSACRGADGTLYFGSMKGICCFNPLGLDTMSRRAGSVQIIECRGMDSRTGRGGKLILPGENGEIELPYHRNAFRISFSVPICTERRWNMLQDRRIGTGMGQYRRGKTRLRSVTCLSGLIPSE